MEIHQDIVPVNLEEAVATVRMGLSPEDCRIASVAKGPESLPREIGEAIRNEWTMWDAESRLRNFFRIKYELNHADDVTELILHCVIADIQNKPREIDFIVNRCKLNWQGTIGKPMP